MPSTAPTAAVAKLTAALPLGCASGHRVGGGWASGVVRLGGTQWCGPAAADEVSVPAQDRRGCDQQSAAATSGQESDETPITARSVQLIRGRDRWRCRTAS